MSPSRNLLRPSRRRHLRPPGFTLVELLVTITIVIALAALAFTIFGRTKKAAERVDCVNRLRQASAMLLASSNDSNGRIRAFRGGSGSFDFRPYFIVADELQLRSNSQVTDTEAMQDIMSCPSAPNPQTPHWTCYGVNFTDNEQMGAVWKDEQVKDEAGRTGNVSSLLVSTVTRPSGYVLIADSCQSNGQQIFRIRGGDKVGLRHDGRANVAFLDGSVRSMSPADLGGIGFKSAFDTSFDPPQSVSLPQGN